MGNGLTPQVIAETENILVLDKPAGLIVHSDGRNEERSLAGWLIENYPGLANVGEPWISPQGAHVLLPGIVHRLDKTTSGVILVAKTKKSYIALKNAFKNRAVKKTYRALVYGHPEADDGTIVAEIMRSSEAPRRWYARPCDGDDKRAAITGWRVLKRIEGGSEPVSYLELEPATGRTHQLRVHLASIGHPVVSDHLYAAGRKQLFGFERPALHAYSIMLITDGKEMTFTAPLPADFEANI